MIPTRGNHEPFVLQQFVMKLNVPGNIARRPGVGMYPGPKRDVRCNRVSSPPTRLTRGWRFQFEKCKFTLTSVHKTFHPIWDARDCSLPIGIVVQVLHTRACASPSRPFGIPLNSIGPSCMLHKVWWQDCQSKSNIEIGQLPAHELKGEKAVPCKRSIQRLKQPNRYYLSQVAAASSSCIRVSYSVSYCKSDDHVFQGRPLGSACCSIVQFCNCRTRGTLVAHMLSGNANNAGASPASPRLLDRFVP